MRTYSPGGILTAFATAPRSNASQHLVFIVYGVDYACTQGAAVAAPVAGKVVSAGAEGNWGTVVVLEDAAGRSWRLCGVADPAVKAGDTVTAGQKLGTVGTVGCECAEESHIHVEVKQGESYLDPAKLPE